MCDFKLLKYLNCFTHKLHLYGLSARGESIKPATQTSLFECSSSFKFCSRGTRGFFLSLHWILVWVRCEGFNVFSVNCSLEGRAKSFVFSFISSAWFSLSFSERIQLYFLNLGLSLVKRKHRNTLTGITVRKDGETINIWVIKSYMITLYLSPSKEVNPTLLLAIDPSYEEKRHYYKISIFRWQLTVTIHLVLFNWAFFRTINFVYSI